MTTELQNNFYWLFHHENYYSDDELRRQMMDSEISSLLTITWSLDWNNERVVWWSYAGQRDLSLCSYKLPLPLFLYQCQKTGAKACVDYFNCEENYSNYFEIWKFQRGLVFLCFQFYDNGIFANVGSFFPWIVVNCWVPVVLWTFPYFDCLWLFWYTHELMQSPHRWGCWKAYHKYTRNVSVLSVHYFTNAINA